MSHDAVITTLKSLRLHGMAQALDELAQQGAPLFHRCNCVRAQHLKGRPAIFALSRRRT